MKDVGTITKGDLFARMFPHGTLDFIAIVEGKGMNPDTEIAICENYPFSLQAVGCTDSGFVTGEYVALCPYIDTSNIPQNVASTKLVLHIGARTYTIQSSNIKRISGNPVYSMKDVDGLEWQIGTRIHFASPTRLDW